jgi:manganese efflux pump family protein
MTLFATILLAFSLSTDAFAASVAAGAQPRRLSTDRAISVAASFALFESLALGLGYVFGSSFGHWLADVDHWLAFGLLAVLGVRMIVRAGAATDDADRDCPRQWPAVLLTSLATSIDGLVVGMTLALVTDAILPTLLTIAAVCFVMTWIGLRIGRTAGQGIGSVIETLGGLCLVAIGVKILVSHLYF